ncbi:uncharacterized protein ACMZJ9_002311 [Mantella aurantiaca]
MGTHVWRKQFPLLCSNLTCMFQIMFIFVVVLRDSMLLSIAPVSDRPQENVNVNYTVMDWSNGATGQAAPVGCLTQYPHNLSNRTTHEYRMQLSIGDGLFIFGFIGTLVVLKSLLTKITMVENKPDHSEHVMSTCESPPTYKITINRRVSVVYDKSNGKVTPPNSPGLGQALSMSLIGSPVSYNGDQCCGLSNHDKQHLYYGAQCLFSSPDSTMSLV